MKKWVPGCLGYVGDEILPSYMGIILNHYFERDHFLKGKTLNPTMILNKGMDVLVKTGEYSNPWLSSTANLMSPPFLVTFH